MKKEKEKKETTKYEFLSVSVRELIDAVRHGINTGLKPQTVKKFETWIESERYLPPEGSRETGLYRIDRFPHVRDIINALCLHSKVKKVVLVAPTQIGKTEIGNSFFMYTADQLPGPFKMVLPTGDLGKNHSRTKLQPAINLMPCLRDKILPPENRRAQNTILFKKFPGGSLEINGSNSDNVARSASIRYLFLSDVDGFSDDMSGTGDTISLLEKRTDSFGDAAKIFMESQIGKKGKGVLGANVSRILFEFEKGSQGIRKVPCPYCGEYQVLSFRWDEVEKLEDGKKLLNGMRYEIDKNENLMDVYFVCKHCGERIDENKKVEMELKGVYEHKYPDRFEDCASFWLNGFSSPSGLVSWRKIIQEFIDAFKMSERGDFSSMQVFVNVRMVELFKKGIKSTDYKELMNRKEAYDLGGVVTHRIEKVTIGVDVHPNHVDVLVLGWGMYFESWVLEWKVIPVDDIESLNWFKDLDYYLEKYDSEKTSLPMRMGIDSGYKAHLVYNYARFKKENVIVLKGSSSYGQPILSPPKKRDINHKGEVIKKGIKVWSVGTDTTKEYIFSWLENDYRRKERIDGALPGCVHFSHELPDDFFEQLAGEVLKTQMDKNGFPVKRYVKIGENHSLDCFVYARAVLEVIGGAFLGISKEDREKLKHKIENEKKAHMATKRKVFDPRERRNVLNSGVSSIRNQLKNFHGNRR
jgi:phage terminase large subunit GpA-like protein